MSRTHIYSVRLRRPVGPQNYIRTRSALYKTDTGHKQNGQTDIYIHGVRVSKEVRYYMHMVCLIYSVSLRRPRWSPDTKWTFGYIHPLVINKMEVGHIQIRQSVVYMSRPAPTKPPLAASGPYTKSWPQSYTAFIQHVELLADQVTEPASSPTVPRQKVIQLTSAGSWLRIKCLGRPSLTPKKKRGAMRCKHELSEWNLGNNKFISQAMPIEDEGFRSSRCEETQHKWPIWKTLSSDRRLNRAHPLTYRSGFVILRQS